MSVYANNSFSPELTEAYTPLKTEATALNYSPKGHRSTAFDEFRTIEHNNKNILNNDSVSFQKEVGQEEIEEMCEWMRLVNFYSQEVRHKNIVIKQKVVLLQRLEMERQGIEGRLETTNKQFNYKKAYLSSKRKKLLQHRRDQGLSMNEEIKGLKAKIVRVRSKMRCLTQGSFQSCSSVNSSLYSIGDRRGKEKRRAEYFSGYKTNPHSPKMRVKQKVKIYVPVLFSPQYQAHSPFHAHQYSQRKLADNQGNPNLVYFNNLNYSSQSEMFLKNDSDEFSFQNRMSDFKNKLEGVLSKSSQRESQKLRGSKGSSDIQQSRKNSGKSRQQELLGSRHAHFSQDQITKETNQYPKSEIKKSKRHEEYLPQRPPFYRKKTSEHGRKLSSVKQEHQTLKASIPSDKDQNTGNAKQVIGKFKPPQHSPRKIPEQSVVAIQSKFMSAIKSIQDSNEMGSPTKLSGVFVKKSEMAQSVVPNQPSKTSQVMVDSRRVGSLNLNASALAESTYEVSPRRLDVSHSSCQEVKIQILSQASHITQKDREKLQEKEQNQDEEDILSLINLSGQSRISRQRNVNKSALRQSRNQMKKSQEMEGYSLMRDSMIKKKRRKNVKQQEYEQPNEDNIFIGAPSKIMARPINKTQMQKYSAIMTSSIEEASQGQEDMSCATTRKKNIQPPKSHR